MKILVLNGSPHENSSTMILTQSFISGLGITEDDEVKVVDSYRKNIKYCMGDLSCWFRQDGHCIIQDDDMNEVLDDIKGSDIIIWSFPLHVHGMPASLKAILDRTIAFLKINMVQDGSLVEHERSFDLTAKKNVFIIAGGYPHYPDNFTAVKAHLNTYFKKPLTICVCETALLGEESPELEPLKEGLFAKIASAGQEFAKTATVSDELIESIASPLIPNEMYINIINSLAPNQ